GALLQRTQGVRRADQPSPGGGVHDRRYRHRTGCHAHAHLSRRLPCRTGQTVPARGPSRPYPGQGKSHEDRHRRRSASWRPWLHQGIPVGTLVPGFACHRRRLRRPAPLRRESTMNIEIPRKFKPLINNAYQVARNTLRPISRKYDRGEHQHPKELDMLAAVLDGFNEGDPANSAGAATTGGKRADQGDGGVKNGANMGVCLGAMEMCYGDTGFLLAMPRQGLGNAAIAAVANDEQRERFKGKWAAMA